VSFPCYGHHFELRLELERAISPLYPPSPSHFELHPVFPQIYHRRRHGVRALNLPSVERLWPIRDTGAPLSLSYTLSSNSSSSSLTLGYPATVRHLPPGRHYCRPLSARHGRAEPRPFTHPRIHCDHTPHTSAPQNAPRGNEHLTAPPYLLWRAATAAAGAYRHREGHQPSRDRIDSSGG
jgi:hypothetical protein